MSAPAASVTLPLTIQLLEWLAAAPRTRAEVVETWRTTCPRLSIWEDALADGLVAHDGGRIVLTPSGRALLRGPATDR